MLNRLATTLKPQTMPLGKRGDTIIEVLIAIGIVSLVLTSAYAVTNYNAQSAQKTQEQGQAQRLVEGQIELMRSYGGDPAGGCLAVNSGVVAKNTEDSCENITAAGSGAEYVLSITRPNAATEPNKYAVSAKWDALGGQKGNVTMYYRR